MNDGAISHTHTHDNNVGICSTKCCAAQSDPVRCNTMVARQEEGPTEYGTHRLTSLRWLFDALNSVASSLCKQWTFQNTRKEGVCVIPDRRETERRASEVKEGEGGERARSG
jgi:hypothetical protein